ncbi:MAG: hypothetical protein C3F02_01590 [Parcubacteria group bacterium]|nr:MAG: hypothetical protein C3F02_01590 [Parcubacteria group bacterium]
MGITIKHKRLKKNANPGPKSCSIHNTLSLDKQLLFSSFDQAYYSAIIDLYGLIGILKAFEILPVKVELVVTIHPDGVGYDGQLIYYNESDREIAENLLCYLRHQADLYQERHGSMLSRVGLTLRQMCFVHDDR